MEYEIYQETFRSNIKMLYGNGRRLSSLRLSLSPSSGGAATNFALVVVLWMVGNERRRWKHGQWFDHKDSLVNLMLRSISGTAQRAFMSMFCIPRYIIKMKIRVSIKTQTDAISIMIEEMEMMRSRGGEHETSMIHAWKGGRLRVVGG